MGKLRKLILWSVAILLLSLSLAFSAFFLWQALSKRSIADYLYQAENAYRQEKYDNAKKALVAVLKMDENNEKALRLLAEIAEREQRFYAAVQVWKRLISINPLDESLILRYVTALNLIADYRTVKQILEPRRKSRKLTEAEALELVRAELMTWNKDAAAAIFKTVRRTEQNAGVYDLLRADFYLTDGHKEKAEQLYRRILHEKISVMTRFQALMRLVSLVPEKEKEAYLKKAMEIQPQQGTAALAEYYLANGKFQSVVTLLQDIPEKNFSPMMHLLLAEAYASLGQTGKIAGISQNLDVRDRREIALKNYLEAIETFMKSDFKETARALNASRDFSNRSLYLYMKLITDIAVKQPVQDIVASAKNLYLLSGAGSRSQISGVLLPLIRNCVENGKYADGIIYGDFLNSIQIDSNALDELMLLCYLRSNIQDYKSHVLAMKIMKRSPDDLNALQYMALYSLNHGNLQDARKLLKILLKKQPDSLFVLFSLANMEEQSKNTAMAERYLMTALAAHPDDPQVSSAVFAFYMRNDPAKAMTFAKEQALSPKKQKKAQAIVFQGIAAYTKRQLPQAVSFFEKAIQVDAKLPQAYWYLFMIAAPAEKEKWLTEGLAQNPDDPTLLANLASLYASQNQEKKAAETYEKLHSYLQKDPLLMINYSEVLASIGRKNEAMEYAIKAKELAPNNLMVRECYGMREFERNNYAPAIRELEIILKNNPKNVRVKAALLSAYCKNGLRLTGEGSLKDAEQMYRKALLLDPNHKAAQQGLLIIRQKLGK